MSPRPHPLWPAVEACLPALWRAVRAYEADRALQEDLLQEVLLAAWQALPSVRDPAAVRAFALRIAHNLGASHVRSAVRRPPGEDLDALAAVAAPEDDPRSRWLLEAMRALPLSLRQPLMLQLEGFDYREIAAMTGLSPENVGVRLHRARARLTAQSLEDAPDAAR